MNMKYNVIFHFEGCDFESELYKSLVKSEFVRIYNSFCDKVNPLCEVWNKEYNVPDQVQKYESFIYEKSLPIAKSLRTHWLVGDVDKDSATFIARMKGLPESKIYITLKEIDA